MKDEQNKINFTILCTMQFVGKGNILHKYNFSHNLKMEEVKYCTFHRWNPASVCQNRPL